MITPDGNMPKITATGVAAGPGPVRVVRGSA